MIATAWDDIPQTPGPQEISLSGKLHIERLELSTKIEKLKTFMTMSPDFKALHYRQARLLEEQLAAMQMYESILVQRMTLLNNPNNN
jgi:hypothetical protein